MFFITDNSVPILLLLTAVAVVALVAGMPKRKTVAGVCVLAAVGLLLLEQTLVSPGEEVEMQLEQMLTNFRSRDLDAIAGQISKQSPDLIEKAKRGLDLVDVSEQFRIKSVEVELNDDITQATAFLRANGPLTIRAQGGGSRNMPTYWRTVWVREDDSWKLYQAARLNPVNGDEIEMYGPGN